MSLAIAVEPPEQFAADRHAETNDDVLHDKASKGLVAGVFALFLGRDLDPLAGFGGAADGGVDEGHTGDAVVDVGMREGFGRGLAAIAANGPFERAMQVGDAPRGSPRDDPPEHGHKA